MIIELAQIYFKSLTILNGQSPSFAGILKFSQVSIKSLWPNQAIDDKLDTAILPNLC